MQRARRIVLTGIVISLVIAAGFLVIGGWEAFSGPYHKTGDIALRLSQAAYERNEKANDRLIDTWWKYQIFTWKWWFNIGMAVIPWVVWVRIRKKGSTHRLLYVGFFLLITASYLDFIGATYGLWRYHIEILPSMPSYIPWDFTMYPVAGMLLIQYEPRLSKHLKAVLFACTAALVIEPLFIWLQFYEPVQWSVFYSWPIHYVIYLTADWLSTRNGFRPLDTEWHPPKNTGRVRRS